jgi:mannitol-specific phosphotransferase system IIBC component
LVAAITVRVIAEGAGGVCAAAVATNTTALSSTIPVILNRMIASQVYGYLEHHTRSQRS